MSKEPLEKWAAELKKRGIKTFESKNLPDDLRHRPTIIKAKYAGIIKKTRISKDGPKGSTIRNVWEVA